MELNEKWGDTQMHSCDIDGRIGRGRYQNETSVHSAVRARLSWLEKEAEAASHWNKAVGRGGFDTVADQHPGAQGWYSVPSVTRETWTVRDSSAVLGLY